MGDVYLAEQPVTKRHVALKTLRHGELVDNRRRADAAFATRSRSWRSSGTRNIVAIYDGNGLHEEPPFFVMQR